MKFNVNKTESSESNTMTLDIFGLSLSNANRITKSGGVISLYGGYVGATGLLFKGSIRDVSRGRENAEIVTSIEAGDGDEVTVNAYINATFPSGTPLKTLVSKLAQTIPNTIVGDISPLPSVNVPSPSALIGDTETSLDSLASTYGFKWSVQDGIFQVSADKVVVRDIASLSPGTGLLGIPRIEKDGEVAIKCLLNHSIRPNKLVKIDKIDSRLVLDNSYESEHHGVAAGMFKVVEMKHVGSNFSTDYYTEITKAERISSGGETIKTKRQTDLRLTK